MFVTFYAYICGMTNTKMGKEKPDVLVISFPQSHKELHDAIISNAEKNKVSVAHYVRSLLYASMKNQK